MGGGGLACGWLTTGGCKLRRGGKLAACGGATSRGGENAGYDGIAKGANCWLEAAIGTSAGSLAKVAAKCWLDAATGNFAGSLAGVAAGTAATVAAGDGRWLHAASPTSLSGASPLCKTLPSSSMISKALRGILPRQQRSTTLSSRALRVWWRRSWMPVLFTTSGVSNTSCRLSAHPSACHHNLIYLPTCHARTCWKQAGHANPL